MICRSRDGKFLAIKFQEWFLSNKSKFSVIMRFHTTCPVPGPVGCRRELCGSSWRARPLIARPRSETYNERVGTSAGVRGLGSSLAGDDGGAGAGPAAASSRGGQRRPRAWRRPTSATRPAVIRAVRELADAIASSPSKTPQGPVLVQDAQVSCPWPSANSRARCGRRPIRCGAGSSIRGSTRAGIISSAARAGGKFVAGRGRRGQAQPEEADRSSTSSSA